MNGNGYVASVQDQRGRRIYLTEEHWQHICDERPEMRDYSGHVLEAVRLGRRFQDFIRPYVYLYYRDHFDLPLGNTTVVVVVRFGYNTEGDENNFVLTGYQIRRRRAMPR